MVDVQTDAQLPLGMRMDSQEKDTPNASFKTPSLRELTVPKGYLLIEPGQLYQLGKLQEQTAPIYIHDEVNNADGQGGLVKIDDLIEYARAGQTSTETITIPNFEITKEQEKAAKQLAHPGEPEKPEEKKAPRQLETLEVNIFHNIAGLVKTELGSMLVVDKEVEYTVAKAIAAYRAQLGEGDFTDKLATREAELRHQLEIRSGSVRESILAGAKRFYEEFKDKESSDPLVADIHTSIILAELIGQYRIHPSEELKQQIELAVTRLQKRPESAQMSEQPAFSEVQPERQYIKNEVPVDEQTFYFSGKEGNSLVQKLYEGKIITQADMITELDSEERFGKRGSLISIHLPLETLMNRLEACTDDELIELTLMTLNQRIDPSKLKYDEKISFLDRMVSDLRKFIDQKRDDMVPRVMTMLDREIPATETDLYFAYAAYRIAEMVELKKDHLADAAFGIQAKLMNIFSNPTETVLKVKKIIEAKKQEINAVTGQLNKPLERELGK